MGHASTDVLCMAIPSDRKAAVLPGLSTVRTLIGDTSFLTARWNLNADFGTITTGYMTEHFSRFGRNEIAAGRRFSFDAFPAVSFAYEGRRSECPKNLVHIHVQLRC